jgi:hypothetical protein
MFEAEQDLLHCHPPFTYNAGRIQQHQAGQQPQDQMAIVGNFLFHLARLHGQQMLQRPEAAFNPAPPAPGADQTGARMVVSRQSR